MSRTVKLLLLGTLNTYWTKNHLENKISKFWEFPHNIITPRSQSLFEFFDHNLDLPFLIFIHWLHVIYLARLDNLCGVSTEYKSFLLGPRGNDVKNIWKTKAQRPTNDHFSNMYAHILSHSFEILFHKFDSILHRNVPKCFGNVIP